MFRPNPSRKPKATEEKLTINALLRRKRKKLASDQAGTPWNKGRLVGAKLALKPKHV